MTNDDSVDPQLTESRWRESERVFQQAFQAAPTPIVLTRLADGIIVAANEAFLKTTGYTAAEVVGQSVSALNIYASPEQRDEYLRILRESGLVRDREQLLRTKSGAVRTILLSGEIVELHGQPHLLTAGLDITERKVAETRLRDSEAHLRTVVDHNPAGIVVMDVDRDRYIEANETAVRLTGYSREELLSQGPVDSAPSHQPDGRRSEDVAREMIGKVLQCGHCTFEWMIRTADGRLIPSEIRAARVPIPDRNLIVASIVDITARKQAEIELHKTIERERELNELKTGFVSMVSHEFRTPLEVILSSTDILGRYLDRLTATERAEHVAAIQHSVKRMSGMMEDVMLLGRFESDRQQFTPDDLHLKAFCRRLADEMRSATAGKCPIELTLGDALPLARADEKLLRHILTNLLSNAVKYSAPGKPVRFTLAREGNAAVFRISDSGLGIPAADQAHLFEAFHRGGNTAQIPGTGLGLVIVKRSVELHGGSVEFSSTEGQGTHFTVRLPAFTESES